MPIQVPLLSAHTKQRAGINSNVVLPGGEPIALWPRNELFGIPAQDGNCSVVSDSISDDGTTSPEGSGAHELTLTGIDANFDAVSDVVVLQGTTPVVATKSFLFVDFMKVNKVGSNESNAGTINASILDGGSEPVTCVIPPGETTSSDVIMAISNPLVTPTRKPLEQSWFLLSASVALGDPSPGNAPNSAKVAVSTFDLTTNIRTMGLNMLLNSNSPTMGKEFSIPIPIRPGTIVYLEVEETSANGLEISGILEAGLSPISPVFYGFIDWLKSH